MTHETAPQTELVATNCCVCNRPLCDAESVEAGIGPVCREKHGYNIDVDPASRQAANGLVWRLAAGVVDVAEAIEKLQGLGFERLAARLAERCTEILIDEVDGVLRIATPYNADATAAWRSIPGRRWDRDDKVNTVPASAKADVWRLLKAHHAGSLAFGPKGLFRI